MFGFKKEQLGFAMMLAPIAAVALFAVEVITVITLFIVGKIL